LFENAASVLPPISFFLSFQLAHKKHAPSHNATADPAICPATPSSDNSAGNCLGNLMCLTVGHCNSKTGPLFVVVHLGGVFQLTLITLVWTIVEQCGCLHMKN